MKFTYLMIQELFFYHEDNYEEYDDDDDDLFLSHFIVKLNLF